MSFWEKVDPLVFQFDFVKFGVVLLVRIVIRAYNPLNLER